MKGRVVIAGGSGFIGRHLSDRLVADGYDIVILSRSAKTKKGAVRTVQWDGETQGPWTTELDGAHALINLAGRSINCRHSIKNRLAIRSSRISSVQLLGEACLKATIPPSVWIQASAVGIYGDA